ncbi:unnamed protein product [Discosporangium mesarthrocarpum]
MQIRVALTAAIALWNLLALAGASAGDRDRWYRACVKRCNKDDGCVGPRRVPTNDVASENFAESPEGVPAETGDERAWYLRMLGWGCKSECGYKCMSQHVEYRSQMGMPMLQYHGKWPFRLE